MARLPVARFCFFEARLFPLVVQCASDSCCLCPDRGFFSSLLARTSSPIAELWSFRPLVGPRSPLLTLGCAGVTFLVVPQRQRLLLCGAWFAVAVTWCQVTMLVVVGSVLGPAPSPLVSWGRRLLDATHLWSLFSACPVTLLCSTPGLNPLCCGVVPRWLLCLGVLLSGPIVPPACCSAYRLWRLVTVSYAGAGPPTPSCYLCSLASLVSSCASSSISVSPG